MSDCELSVERISEVRQFLDKQFKFQLGDLVYFCAAKRDRHENPRRFQIEEQAVFKTCGGVDFYYSITGVNGVVPESALTSQQPEYDFSEDVTAHKAERVAMGFDD